MWLALTDLQKIAISCRETPDHLQHTRFNYTVVCCNWLSIYSTPSSITVLLVVTGCLFTAGQVQLHCCL